MARPKKISDCGADGCGECDVCKYLDHLEWAHQVAPSNLPIPANIRLDAEIEAYCDEHYPHWRGTK